MKDFNDNRIKVINLDTDSIRNYENQYVGCLIVTADNKLLLQKRSENCFHYPNFISTFGGKVEKGETPYEALVRELNEELGATIVNSDLKFIGAITEGFSNHTDLVYEYFWYDSQDSITGCYEESPLYFDNLSSILKLGNKVMDDVIWVLGKCKGIGLLYQFINNE